MQGTEFYLGSRVVFGEESLDLLGNLATDLGGRRILIVTDEGIVGAGILERAILSLERHSLETIVYEGVEENPTTRHVKEGVAVAESQSPIDLIVGLGGGSPMDCAKGINFLLTNGGVMEDYQGRNKASKPMLPSIGIPTTAGTGSEAQSFAVIAKEKTHEKIACGDPKAHFRTTILDPVLTLSMPRNVTVSTGFDAISHAVETCVTTVRNPISEMFSKQAWDLLSENFGIVMKDPGNLEARRQMLLGAHLGGAAIEHSMLGAAHACANPLTARYGISHGTAVGLMLPHVIRFNSEAEDLATRSEVNKHYHDLLLTGNTTHRSQETSGKKLADRISELTMAAGLPQRLRELKLERRDLPRLAREAADQWTAKFNPREVTEIELLQLYKAAY